MQSYWAQMFTLLTKVLQIIEVHYRRFLWSRTNLITKKALVAWNRVCLRKEGGGLNLTNLKCWKNAALTKTYQDLSRKKDSFWIKQIHEYYIKGRQINEIPIPQQSCQMIRQVINSREILNQIYREFNPKKSMIQQIYLQLMGNYSKVP